MLDHDPIRLSGAAGLAEPVELDACRRHRELQRMGDLACGEGAGDSEVRDDKPGHWRGRGAAGALRTMHATALPVRGLLQVPSEDEQRQQEADSEAEEQRAELQVHEQGSPMG